ncbi:DUF6708 domain-containing protein [Luteimonas abyssi]|uniref:DUF6708 domain-containing protein n=1 Tax=Luteimonas abyssi TaxID=1247514 RepID=UPI000737D3CB|nr:DUF6708 domain-containing protein [Luteimonas abyssi]
MDYTGLGRFIRYKLNRPLTDEERASQLRSDKQASSEPQDWLSVIKLNSTYLELVDRWYPVKGWWTWMGAMIAIPCMGFVAALALIAFERNEFAGWMTLAFVAPVFGLFGWAALSMVHTEAFRQTHYPIRLNRKTRKVYAFRPDGTVLQAPWDRLFLCAVKNELTMWQSSQDVRAHILDEDGETVKDTFTLAYHEFSGRDELMQLWEYIRRYMEEPDGVEQCHQEVSLCLPVDGRREGLAFGIVRTFAMAANQLAIQLIASPIAALTVMGRWFSMYTSKVPVWPAEVEAACQIDADDPYQKNWRSNGQYDFYELWWPAVCFVIGLAVVVGGIWWLLSSLL